MNKKGVLGLDTVKVVILSLLVLALLVIVLMIIMPILLGVQEASYSYSGRVVNETTSAVITETPGVVLTTAGTWRNPICTVLFVQNRSTTTTAIPATNYTLSQGGCRIQSPATFGNAWYNGSIWNITYTYTYDTWDAYNLAENTTSGTSGFFSYVPTFMVLLAVVVLILIIAIVIAAVQGFDVGAGVRGAISSARESAGF